MKVKIKNILKNKCFWSSVLECLCTIFIIIVCYLIGFSNGVLIDNEIRQEFINENLKTDKQVNTFNKKSAINVNDVPTYDGSISISQSGTFNIGVVKSSSSARFIMLDYTISIGQPDGSTNQVFYSITLDIDLSDNFGNNAYQDLNNVRDIYTSFFYTNYYGYHDISLEYLKNFECNFIPSVSKQVDTISNTEKLYFRIDLQLEFVSVNNMSTYDEIRSEDYIVSGFNTLNLAFVSTNNYSILFKDVNQLLQYYYNGYINGYDNGEQIGYDNGLIQGYENRKNSVEDQEQVTNNIWSILEKGIETTLNVLSMEILPGIPLFVCIAIPILIGILVWVVKLGAQ